MRVAQMRVRGGSQRVRQQGGLEAERARSLGFRVQSVGFRAWSLGLYTGILMASM